MGSSTAETGRHQEDPTMTQQDPNLINMRVAVLKRERDKNIGIGITAKQLVGSRSDSMVA